MDSDTESWTEISREIDDHVFKDDSANDSESEASDNEESKPEPAETPVYGATLEQLDKLWGEGRWKITAMHLADYIAQKDYLPIQYCCGQIHD